MERLTKKGFKFTADYVVTRMQSWAIAECLEKLQKYEDAEETGRLIALPCTIGQKVYYIGTLNYTEPTVFGITVDELLYPIAFRTYDFIFDKSDIGKTVFLTKNEAQRALEDKK